MSHILIKKGKDFRLTSLPLLTSPETGRTPSCRTGHPTTSILLRCLCHAIPGFLLSLHTGEDLVRARGTQVQVVWLVLHERIRTADRLAVRSWPHDLICHLCRQEPETARHLCMKCPFSKAVWVMSWLGRVTMPPPSRWLPTRGESLTGCIPWFPLSQKTRGVSRAVSSCTIYLWNIWKERNRRIFRGTHMTHFEVAALAFEDFSQRQMAFGRPHVSEGIG